MDHSTDSMKVLQRWLVTRVFVCIEPMEGTEACASSPMPDEKTTSISRASVDKDSAVFGFNAALTLTARDFCVGIGLPMALEF